MTDPTRRDRRAERARRQRHQRVAIAGGLVLVVAIGVTVFFVGFGDDDAPSAKGSGTSTTTTGATTATSSPGSSATPSSSTPPETTTAAPASTTPPPLANAPAENLNAPGAACGGDNQPAIAGTWQATAPTDPVDGGKVELDLRQQDGTSVAGLPVTAVVTLPGGRTFPSNPVPVAPLGSDAKVAFPDDFPGADRFRFAGNSGFYGVRWQTVGGGSLACAGFAVR